MQGENKQETEGETRKRDWETLEKRERLGDTRKERETGRVTR